MAKKKTIKRTLKLRHKGTYASTYHELIEDGWAIFGAVSCDNNSLIKQFGKIPLTIDITFKAGEEDGKL